MSVAGLRASDAARPGRGAPARAYRHPVNKQVYEAAPLGARVADRVTGFMGSWRFIVRRIRKG